MCWLGIDVLLLSRFRVDWFMLSLGMGDLIYDQNHCDLYSQAFYWHPYVRSTPFWIVTSRTLLFLINTTQIIDYFLRVQILRVDLLVKPF